MSIVINLIIRLPVQIQFEENPKASNTKLEENILNLVTENTFLLLYIGFYHFNFWFKLIDKKVDFITRKKRGQQFPMQQVFTDSYALRYRNICLGSGTKKTPFITLRLIEIRSGKTWNYYLTSVL